ncbi:MAG: hydrolase [Ruminococcus sp.]|nr:hydrolase [Ruminococcus sp.]MDE7104330.1 hydrolase [Ruminococcus sp.]
MIFYTADLHIGHTNIMKLSNRPFKTVEDMNETLVNNWNSVVMEDDDVYILGDVFFKLNSHPEMYLKRMNGKKHLIVGNHDKQYLEKEMFVNQFATINDYLVINDENRKVVLFHYPILEWDGYFRGYYHVYGHIHNNDNNLANQIMKKVPNSFNAGVDVNDFIPQTLTQLIKRNQVVY